MGVALDHLAIDRALARAVSGPAVDWPILAAAAGSDEAVAGRIAYHGLAGLLIDKLGNASGRSAAPLAAIRQATLADAMWELRHRHLLNELLAALAAERIVAILLKGTALAYDLYPAPAARPRGDTDLLIAPRDVARTRKLFARLGFRLHSGNVAIADADSLQEVWTRSVDGAIEHHIDLHWQLLNSPALRDLLPFDACAVDLVRLPRLGPDAYAMDRARSLFHACVHRAMHFTAPYFVDGTEYYGGDRLIWLYDIHLLAGVLSDAQWSVFAALAEVNDVADLCHDGLTMTQRFFATPIPAAIGARLNAAGTASGAAYFRGRQLGRAWADFRAIPGLRRKFGYFRARMVPPADFMRDKYPGLVGVPLPLLYARRLVELVRTRPGRRDR